MKANKFLFSFLIVLVMNCPIFAQDSLVKHQFFIQPYQLLFRELAVGYEHVFSNRFALSISGSYKFQNPRADTLFQTSGSGTLGGSYTSEKLFNPFYNAAGISISSKYFTSNNVYFSAEILYKYWWFDKKWVRYDNVECYSFDALRTERVEDVNLKLLVGYRIEKPLFFYKKWSSVIQFYGGLSFISRKYTYESWGGTVAREPNIYAYETQRVPVITPFFGCTFGIGLSRK